MTAKSFTEFHFSSELIRALERLNYKKPTKVQSKVIPLVLANRDVVVKSQTGSGKTASYGIPICELLNWEENKPQALILTPTRELAVQVKDDINNIGRFKRIKAAAVYGKQPIAIQKTELKQKTHAVVGTPGRVFDLIERGYLNVDRIRYLVIDEADEMLDMGFIDQVEAIINRLPGERVTMLFSATFPPELKNIASLYMRNPIDIEIEETSIAAPKIKHSLYWSEENEKFVLLMDVTILENPDSCIIFCRTKDRVDEVHNFLRKKGYPCDKIHGDLKQERRLAVMDQFRKGAFRYLIATDVAARGIDIDNISLVINFDIPYDKESYVHRTGRTGRAGKSGEAISFVTEDEEGYLNEIEEYLGFEISVKTLPPREDIIKMKPAFEATMKTAPARKKAKNEQLNKEIMKLYFNGGKKKKLRAVDFVGTITNIDGINAEDIGVIAITDSATFIDILNGKGPLVLREMKNRTVKGKQLKVHEARD